MLPSHCPSCGSELVRARRGVLGRLLLIRRYRCVKCRRTENVYRYWLSLEARCPRCGNHELKRLRGFDPIERLYPNPLSLVQALLRAPLLHCRWCRLQFYDLRPVRPAGAAGPQAKKRPETP